MKRFEPAIKIIQSELYRIMGKQVWNQVENKRRIDFTPYTMKAQGLKRAIEILEAHEENKYV